MIESGSITQPNAPEQKIQEVFKDLLKHDGFGGFTVEVKILKRGQKEIIVHYGKQYRYVVDTKG